LTLLGLSRWTWYTVQPDGCTRLRSKAFSVFAATGYLHGESLHPTDVARILDGVEDRRERYRFAVDPGAIPLNEDGLIHSVQIVLSKEADAK